MRWHLTIPGQPLSWNKMYRVGTQVRTDKHGQTKLRADGSPATFRSIFKTEEATRFQDDVYRLTRSAMPSGWRPAGLVVLEYHLFLTRDIDADNILKAINDAIASAIRVDDRIFLPRVMSKKWGVKPREARVEIDIYDVGVA